MLFTDGSDYNSVSVVITFNSRSLNGDALCEEINIINDNDVECDDVFSVSLTTNLSKVVIPPSAQSASVTIDMDENDGTLLFTNLVVTMCVCCSCTYWPEYRQLRNI